MPELDEPLVSVVMPTYGGDRLDYLREAVESVLTQTCRSLELLVVLDGPVSANTRAFLDDVVLRDSRVRIVCLAENTGPAAARNAAFREARGAYIALADADDVSRPERLERQCRFLQETGADVAGTFMRYTTPDGRLLATKETPVEQDQIRRNAILFSPLNNPTVMAKADVFKDNPYDPSFRTAEDYELWVRLLRQGYMMRTQPEYLYDFRTPGRFFAKRRGFACFRNDLRARLGAVKLYPSAIAPILLVAAVALSALRLLPAPLLGLVYRARNAIRYLRTGNAKKENPL